MRLRSTVALGLILLIAATISCSSGDGDEFEMTPGVASPTAGVIQPTAVTPDPTPKPTSSPRPTVAPVVDPGPTASAPEPARLTPTPTPFPPVDVDIAFLTVPVCRTTDGNSNGAGFGTIPHATPTAIPESGSQGGNDLTEPQAFVTALSPLVEAIVATTRAADNAWNVALGDDDLARVILFEGRRLTQLCSALSIVPLTTEGVELIKDAADALNRHRAFLLETTEILRDQPGEAQSMDAARQVSSADLLGLKANLDDFAAEAGVTSIDPAAFTAVNPLLGLTFEAPAGWLAVRNGIDIVLLAPADQQVFSARGLGPDAWKLGTALRIRRFRNNPPWELSDTAATLDSLYARFGNRTHEQSVEVGGVVGILRAYSSVDRHWDTIVAATVVDSQTYLFEHGCPTTLNAQCALQLDRFIQSVLFADN